MISTKLLALFLAVCAGTHATLSLSDGFHLITIDENGQEVVKKLANRTEAPIEWLSKHKHFQYRPAGHSSPEDLVNGTHFADINKRKSSGDATYCDNVNIGINPADLGQAQYQLDLGCSARQTPKKSVSVGIQGDVLIFFCNYDKHHSKSCYPSQADSDISTVQRYCSGFSGWRSHPSQYSSYGYKSQHELSGSGSLAKQICGE